MEYSIEQAEPKRILWEMIKNCLDAEQYETIYCYFVRNATYSLLATDRGVSIEYIRTKKAKALRKLRHNNHIKKLAEDYGYINYYRHVTLAGFKQTWTSSVELEVLSREGYFERMLKELELKYDNAI